MLPNKIRLPAFRRSSAIGCRWCMKHPTMLLLLVLPYWWSVYVSISLHWMKTEPNLSPINEVEWHGEDARRNINHVVCWYVEMCVVMDNKFHSLTCPCLISCVAATMCYRFSCCGGFTRDSVVAKPFLWWFHSNTYVTHHPHNPSQLHTWECD